MATEIDQNARHTKLLLTVPGLEERLLQALMKGASYRLACKYAGCSYEQYREWMRKGERQHNAGVVEGEGDMFHDFMCKVHKAIGYRALKWLEKIDDAMPVHWQAAAWKLERCHPEEYGKDRDDANDPLAENTSEIKKLRETLEKCRKD